MIKPESPEGHTQIRPEDSPRAAGAPKSRATGKKSALAKVDRTAEKTAAPKKRGRPAAGGKTAAAAKRPVGRPKTRDKQAGKQLDAIDDKPVVKIGARAAKKVAPAPSKESLAIRQYLPKDKTYLKEGEVLPAKVVPLPYDARPLSWQDMDIIRSRLNRTKREMVYAMVLQSQGKYHEKISSPTVLPLGTEMLLRAYLERPGDCSWNFPSLTPARVFEMVYGKRLEEFARLVKDNEELVASARVALQKRFAKMLGRSMPSSYRWLDGSEASFNPVLRNLIIKAMDFSEPGVFLENLSKKVWALRGQDFELMAPLPTTKRQIFGRRPRAIENRETKQVYEEVGSFF